MRVTQNMIYDSSMRNMNRRLSDLMTANMENASQKRINKPSDDPAGMDMVLDLRSGLSGIGSYNKNIDTAQAWLTLADSQLSQASTVTSSVMELAEQGATGTYSADDREIMAGEVRQLYEELLSTANAEYLGNSIFAGQKTDSAAYEMRLWATALTDGADEASVMAVRGSSERTVRVEFTSSGDVGTDDLDYRWSSDGGQTWTTSTLTAPDDTLDLGGASMTLAAGTTVAADDTGFMIRPALAYLGDTEDGASVTAFGAPGVTADTRGDFPSDTLVRVDNNTTLPGPVDYSYSLDGGSTWVEGLSSTDGTLALPGGFLDLSPAGTAVGQGAQFAITPDQALIEVNITENTSIAVNNVGKDVFGGLVQDPATGRYVEPQGVPSDENLLETVGKLIGYLEIDDQDGVARCLDGLGGSLEHLLGSAGDVGARLNRLTYTENALSARAAGIETQISSIEDADATELTTELARTEYAYQAVLQSSSQIMGLSLLNYM